MVLEFLGKDLLFACEACRESVTAPREVIGQLVECPFCQQQFVLREHTPPSPEAALAAQVKAENLTKLEGQLCENATQITELRGQVSRLNMELHRHQLRMTKLAERQAELKNEISAARAELGIAD